MPNIDSAPIGAAPLGAAPPQGAGYGAFPTTTPDAPAAPPAPSGAAGDNPDNWSLDHITSTLSDFLWKDPTAIFKLPVIGHIAQGAGGFARGIGGEIGDVLGRIPVGGFAGGADDQFRAAGEVIKANHPEDYAAWQAVNVAAAGDPFGGGQARSNFVRTIAQKYADASKTGDSGIAGYGGTLGAGGSVNDGSLGGLLFNSISSILGTGAHFVQRGLAGAAITGNEGNFTLNGKAWTPPNHNGDRLDAIMAAFNTPGVKMSDVERTVAENYTSGFWDKGRALGYLTDKGQSFTSDPILQIIAGTLTDPLLLATAGQGAVLGVGERGAAVADALGKGIELSRGDAVALAVHTAQTNKVLLPIFKTARALIDPLGVMPTGALTDAIKDIHAGLQGAAFTRAYGAGTQQTLFRDLAQLGPAAVEKLQSLMGSYEANQGALHLAVEAQITMLKAGGELGTIHVNRTVDDVVALMLHSAPKDITTRLTDFMSRTAKNTFTEGELDALAGRLAVVFGNTKEEWAALIPTMSHDTRSAYHALSFEGAARDLREALTNVDGAGYTTAGGKAPLENAVVLNDNNLDALARDDLLALIRKTKNGAEKARIWNEATKKYSLMATLGEMTEGDLTSLGKNLRYLEGKHLPQRMTAEELAHPSLGPIRDLLAKYTVDGQELWHIGFRPREDLAWGLERHPSTGEWMIDRAPTIAQRSDFAPAVAPFSETTRNALGQIIGKGAARVANKPIESTEAFVRTLADQVTGQRLVVNMQRSFERTLMEQHGLPQPVAQQLWREARDMASYNKTTIRGINPQNLWEASKTLIPEAHRGEFGVHDLWAALSDASEGDLRIVGLTSKLTQRIRNMIRRAGLDDTNKLGDLTVTQYNRMRYYFNPQFMVQRVTDGPFYSLAFGFRPVGAGESAVRNRTQAVLDKMAETGVGRDFAMDQPDYAVQMNFVEGMTRRAKQVSGPLEGITKMPSRLIQQNMLNMHYHQMGDTMGEVIAEMRQTYKTLAKERPEEAALGMAETDSIERTMADLRQTWSAETGRPLTNSEFGLRYHEEIFGSMANVTKDANGMPNFKRLISEFDYHKPSNIGQIDPLELDTVAAHYGLTDEKTLRAAIAEGGPNAPTVKTVQAFVKNNLHAHKDYVKRVGDALSFEYNTFWDTVRTESGASSRLTGQMQGVIDRAARMKGMAPGEYLSQIMSTNIGAGSLSNEVGKLAQFLKAGAGGTSKKGGMERLMDLYANSHMEPSQRDVLMEHFADSLPGPFHELPTEEQAAYREQLASEGWVPTRTRIQQLYDEGNAGNPDALSRGATLNRVAGERAGGTGGGGAIRLPGGGDNRSLYEHMLTRDLPDGTLETRPIADIHESLRRDLMDKRFSDLVTERAGGGEGGVAHVNPEVEAATQQFNKFVQEALAPAVGDRQRLLSRYVYDLLDRIPTDQAFAGNRTHTLLQQLLKQKLDLAHKDIFRLAEAQTTRSVLERSLNHPFFGLYPSSYMYGKVFPEAVKFLARNPYGATYDILAVERAVALQREYDPEFRTLADKVEASPLMFLLSYMTPSFPWDGMEASSPPWVRVLGKSGIDISGMTKAEFQTISPERWFTHFLKAGAQLGDLLNQKDPTTGSETGLAPSDAGDPTAAGLAPDSSVNALAPLVGASGGAALPSAPPSYETATPGLGLGSTLSIEEEQLQQLLR